jgi:hypothetical protein
MKMRKFIRGLMSLSELALDVQGWHVGICGGNLRIYRYEERPKVGNSKKGAVSPLL